MHYSVLQRIAAYHEFQRIIAYCSVLQLIIAAYCSTTGRRGGPGPWCCPRASYRTAAYCSVLQRIAAYCSADLGLGAALEGRGEVPGHVPPLPAQPGPVPPPHHPLRPAAAAGRRRDDLGRAPRAARPVGIYYIISYYIIIRHRIVVSWQRIAGRATGAARPGRRAGWGRRD